MYDKCQRNPSCGAALALNCLQWPWCVPTPTMITQYRHGTAYHDHRRDEEHNNHNDHDGAMQPYDIGVGDTAQWMTVLVHQQQEQEQQQHQQRRGTATIDCSSMTQVRLCDMVIPASHNSASHTIAPTMPCSAIARTQTITVYDQLQMGIRYLDIRIAVAAGSKSSSGTASTLSDLEEQSSLSSSSFVIQHGCMSGAALSTVLQQHILRFVQDTTHELIFVEIVPEFGHAMTITQKKQLLNLLQTTFHHMQLTVQAWEKLGGHDITLQQIFAELCSDASSAPKHRVALLLHDRFFQDMPNHGSDDGLDEQTVQETYGIFLSNRHTLNRWYNCRDADQLISWNLEEVQNHGSQRRKHRWLLINQMVLTPGVGSISDVIQAIVGNNVLQPIPLAARQLHQAPKQRINALLRDHADEAWNICMLDAVDCCPYAIDMMISFNFPVEMHLLIAVVDIVGTATSNNTISINVLSTAKRYLCRQNRCLAILDVGTDLQLPASALEASFCILTLGYTLRRQDARVADNNMTEYYLWTMELRLTDDGDEPVPALPILVSSFATNAAATVTRLQSGTSGTVCLGKRQHQRSTTRDDADHDDGANGVLPPPPPPVGLGSVIYYDFVTNPTQCIMSVSLPE